MLRYVPIVIISCNYIFIKKKKTTRTSVWVKIPKLCHNTPLSIFPLGKGRESLRLKPYIKLSTSVLSDLPPACNDLDKASTTHLKNCPKYVYFSRKFSRKSLPTGKKAMKKVASASKEHGGMTVPKLGTVTTPTIKSVVKVPHSALNMQKPTTSNTLPN